jgi:hypothetical protein
LTILSYIKFELLKSKFKRNAVIGMLLVLLIQVAAFLHFKANSILLFEYVDKPNCSYTTYCFYKLSVIHKNVILLLIAVFYFDLFLSQNVNSKNLKLLPINKWNELIGNLLVNTLLLSLFMLVLSILLNKEFDSYIPIHFWEVSPITKTNYFYQMTIEALIALPLVVLVANYCYKLNKTTIILFGLILLLLINSTNHAIGSKNVQLLKIVSFR